MALGSSLGGIYGGCSIFHIFPYFFAGKIQRVCDILLERADDRKQKRKEDYSMDGRIQKIFQILWLLSLPLLIYLSVGDLVFTAWSTVRGRILQEEILPLSAASSGSASLILGIWYERWRKKQDFPNRVSWSFAVCVIMAGSGACLFFNGLMRLLPFPVKGYESVSQILYRPAFATQLLCMGIVIPIGEELVFRGLGYGRMRTKLSYPVAVMVSAVCFGVYHGNLTQGIYAGFLGIFLAILYEKGKSLWGCVLFHGAANGAAVVLTGISLEKRMAGSAGWTAGAMIIGGSLLVASCNKIRRDGKEREAVIHSNTML